MIPQVAIVEQFEEKKDYNYVFIVPEEIKREVKKKKGRKNNDKRNINGSI